jgi:hypothetical protein
MGKNEERERNVKPQKLWALSILLILVLFAAGCQRAPAEPQATREPSPTVSAPTATAPPAQPQEVQPSDDTSPLPRPESGEPAGSMSPLPAPTPTPGSPAEGAVPVPAEAVGAVQAAQADLAEKLGVEKGAIEVLSVEAVDWPDASLGCPQPGMMYAQVITPGFRVLLGVEGQVYEYHTDRGQTAVLCQAPDSSGTVATPSAQARPDVFPVYGIQGSGSAPDAGSSSPNAYQNDVTRVVSTDLAARIGIPADAVKVIAGDRLEIPVASPCGTATKGEKEAAGGGLALGYEVLLEAGNGQHRYVAVGGLAHYCGKQ